MNVPTALDDCHRMIQDLREENAALRKSGEDFGRLAERLSLALRQMRTVRPLSRAIHSTRIPALRRAGEDSVRAVLA